MTNLKKILFFSLLYIFSIGAYSSNNTPLVGQVVTQDIPEGKMALIITINSLSKTSMENVPTKGYLEVYSILGKREKRVKLDNCNGEISIDLSKGLYILKAEKITQKIRVQ